ncbi:hypothetical protein GCM10014715_30460 [Streptomyces spiralis]|uniref:Uncharacterized protein n=1 Tax=Streptomyces spiralis TaxID=66376 RepID=A0A918ZWF3_9ACTN|nr:hypothetical protein GCM10014715_30460 [Streptomyces spiralis]
MTNARTARPRPLGKLSVTSDRAVIEKQSVCTAAGKESEREGGQEVTVTVLAIFLLIIGMLLVLIGALLILIGTFLIAVGATLILMGMAVIAVGAFLLIRRLLDHDRARSHSW